MSIEKDLSRIAAALETIAAKIGTVPAEHSPVTVPYTPPAPAPVQPAAPVTPPAPIPAPPVAVAPVAPAPGSVIPVPFTDAKGMLQYVMDAYKSLGPEKGANIQGVLGSLGHQNINDVTTDQYPALFAGIEALKK